MPARWSALWAMLRRTGEALPWARALSAVVGLLIVVASVAVYVKQTWTEPMSDQAMVYVFGMVLVGLVLITIGGKSGD